MDREDGIVVTPDIDNAIPSQEPTMVREPPFEYIQTPTDTDDENALQDLTSPRTVIDLASSALPGTALPTDEEEQLYGLLQGDFSSSDVISIQVIFQGASNILFHRRDCRSDAGEYKRRDLVQFVIDESQCAKEVQRIPKRDGSCPQHRARLICKGTPCRSERGARGCQKGSQCKYCHTHCRASPAQRSTSGHSVNPSEGTCRGGNSITIILSPDVLPFACAFASVHFVGHLGSVFSLCAALGNHGVLQVEAPPHIRCEGGTRGCRGEQCGVTVQFGNSFFFVGQYKYLGVLRAGADQKSSATTSDDGYSSECSVRELVVQENLMMDDSSERAASTASGQLSHQLDDTINETADSGRELSVPHQDEEQKKIDSFDEFDWTFLEVGSAQKLREELVGLDEPKAEDEPVDPIARTQESGCQSQSQKSGWACKSEGQKTAIGKHEVESFLKRKLSSEIVEQISAELEKGSGFNLPQYTEDEIQAIAFCVKGSLKTRNDVLRGLLCLHDGKASWSSQVSQKGKAEAPGPSRNLQR